MSWAAELDTPAGRPLVVPDPDVRELLPLAREMALLLEPPKLPLLPLLPPNPLPPLLPPNPLPPLLPPNPLLPLPVGLFMRDPLVDVLPKPLPVVLPVREPFELPFPPNKLFSTVCRFCAWAFFSG